MSPSKTTPALDRLLEPVASCLTPDALQRLVDLRADADLEERLSTLADRNTEGLLSGEEREEYETYISAIHVISILQAKARRLLGSHAAR
jgi:hypothetical protein